MSKSEDLFLKAVRLLKKAGLENSSPANKEESGDDSLLPLDQRVKKILELYHDAGQTPERMIFFVMYDIEDDKVRRYVAKYLERKGCVRVQKSVFLAEAHRKIYQEIGETLKEVNNIYTNRDSIYLVPVSSDEIKATRIIGEGFDANLFTDPPGTLIV